MGRNGRRRSAAGLSGGASSRETARREIPPLLRRDVRLLGELLGQVISESSGKNLLRDVEKLRGLVIRARDGGRFERDAERLVASWRLDRAELVARAFACYFHLANLAEEHHRARVIRERDHGTGPVPESIAATMQQLRAKLGRKRLRAVVDSLEVHPVFTAHPTEARRRAVVTAIRRIGDQLERLDNPAASETERGEANRRLLEEVDLLWRTAQLRSAQVQPLDEVRSFMAIFDETLFRIVPDLVRAFGDDRTERSFLRFGSWIGGDRDGNPAVTAQVTAAAMSIHAEHILLALEAAATRIGRSLTVDTDTTPPSTALRRRLAAARRADQARFDTLATRSADEPHRVFLLHIAARIAATRTEGNLAYGSASELLDDLRALRSSLEQAGAVRLAFGEVQNLVWQVETFGFHLAELEVRQHSKAHTDPTPEVLHTMEAIAGLQARFGEAACHRYIVSFTRSADDIAAVHRIAGRATRTPVLDVVPLFETLEDLSHATHVLDGMLTLPHVRTRLAANGRRLEVMLGYSDSAKEIGPLSATLTLHGAQASLARWARRNRIRLTIFHGRGGALGRGGGPANRAVRAQAPGSVGGLFKVTEQGEVIFARYGNRSIARRHLEQVTSAVLEASAVGTSSDPAHRFRALARAIDEPAKAAYRALVEAPGFEAWFLAVSPLEELSGMRIASRPARRAASKRLEDLRAIPWVFAWSQMRLNLPGWYGMGSGLAAAATPLTLS